MSRRGFLTRSASAAFAAAATRGALSAAALAGAGPPSAARAEDEQTQPARDPSEQHQRVAFFLIGDTHYLADKEAPDQLDERSRAITTGLVDTLNALPGTNIPEAAGGGVVAAPRGVIHAGDIIDSGDKSGRAWEKMQTVEFAAYQADFGVDGAGGRLKHPVFEVHGNHDGPQSRGVAIDGLIARNQRRAGLKALSDNGLHCAWDWGPIHCVNLGIVVGQVAEVAQRRRYDPRGSLDFLIEDLRAHVGASGRPVILTHHIDIARYTLPCAADDPLNAQREWHPCDVRAFYQAIRDYNVIAVLYGHTHARNVLTWDGESTRAERGLAVFNVDNSAHFGSDNQAFLYFEVGRDELVVRECATKDGWRTRSWTPQVWRRALVRA